ncbi:hypothetical protein STEG23_020218 [Scotinomys teguina]
MLRMERNRTKEEAERVSFAFILQLPVKCYYGIMGEQMGGMNCNRSYNINLEPDIKDEKENVSKKARRRDIIFLLDIAVICRELISDEDEGKCFLVVLIGIPKLFSFPVLRTGKYSPWMSLLFPLDPKDYALTSGHRLFLLIQPRDYAISSLLLLGLLQDCWVKREAAKHGRGPMSLISGEEDHYQKIDFSTTVIQVFSTCYNEDYDRCNEDMDPMLTSVEYELEKHVEMLELFPVELEKDSEGLGISIIVMGAGANMGLEKLVIFIKSVTWGSTVHQDGSIQINNLLMEVDGTSLVGVTQSFVASILKE